MYESRARYGAVQCIVSCGTKIICEVNCMVAVSDWLMYFLGVLVGGTTANRLRFFAYSTVSQKCVRLEL